MKFKPGEKLKTQGGLPSNPDSVFNEKYMKLAKSLRNWQIAFLSQTILFAISLLGFIKVATQTQIIPYIVEVNKEEGIVKNIGAINRINYVANDKLIMSTLRNFILKTRSIPLDPIMYGRNIKEAYSFLGEIAQTKLKSQIIAEDTKDKIKNKKTIDISITTILKVDNKNYQVRWIETGYDERGNIVEKIKKSGIYTIEIIQSNSEEKLLINPVGITITDYSFNNEM